MASGSTSNEGKPTGTLGNLGQRADSTRGRPKQHHKPHCAGRLAWLKIECGQSEGGGVGDQSCMFT
jgi:hypothetical protein